MSKALKDEIKRKLISEYAGLLSKDSIEAAEVEDAIFKILENIIDRDHRNLSEQEKKAIVRDITAEFIGFGLIDNFINDRDVTEIMINGPKKIFIEKMGKTQLTDVTFHDEQQLMSLIYKILGPTRRHVDEFNPYTEVSLKDGSRVNIIIYPLALNGPVLTIRKISKTIKNAEDLVELNTLDKRMSELLIASIKAKINIIFSGASGAGKTTTLDVCASYISNDERIVTIEDTAELHLTQDHVVGLEARQANIEGKGEIGIRELFKNSLRMRPDRIILGEIRGQEALDMLQAICSGHKGALSVLHANSPQDVVYRLETMILTSGIPLSLEAIHRQIAASVNLIVQQEQFLDGSRKITHITQVNGLKDGQVVLQDLFVYDIESIDSQNRVSGRWRATGVKPVFYPIFKKAGVDLSPEIFNKD